MPGESGVSDRNFRSAGGGEPDTSPSVVNAYVTSQR